MMTGSLLLPRLEGVQAVDLRNALVRDGPATVFSADMLDRLLEAPRAFPPTGGTRVSRARLADLREATWAAVESDAPDPYSVGAFDLAVGRQLAEFGAESRGEMGVAQVWDFLALVLMPDLVARRLRNKRSEVGEGGGVRSRLTGGDRRHVLQRLWKRWTVLGASIVESRALTEDDYVALLERRLTLERGAVARRAAHAVIASGYTGGARREYTRTLMRNLVQMSGIVDLTEQDEAHLDAAFAELHQSTVAVLGSAMPR